MKKLIFIILLLTINYAKAQIKNCYSAKLDSIVMQRYDYYDKETSEINEIERSTTLLASKKLTKKEIEVLNFKLKSKISYKNQRAILSHFNVKLLFYINNKIVQEIIISTLTKNITIYKSENFIYKGQMTPYLEKSINGFLK
jgi:tRNA G10  N-methylase Trm11